MTLTRQHELDRRLQPRLSRSRGARASALFGHSRQLLDAAQELEREAGRQRSRADADDEGALAAIEQLAPALEAIANASLLLSLTARELRRDDQGSQGSVPPPDGDGGGDTDYVTRVLFGASQNIRIAAEASRLAAEAVRPPSPRSTA